MFSLNAELGGECGVLVEDPRKAGTMQCSACLPGRDAAFTTPTSEHFVVLALDGASLRMHSTTDPATPVQTWAPLANHKVVDRIVTGPTEQVMTYAVDGKCIGLLSLADGAQPMGVCQLRACEALVEAHWQQVGGRWFCAALTTHRLLLLDQSLATIAATSAPTAGEEEGGGLHSCLWVGPALLFADCAGVHQLAWDGGVHRVLSVDCPGGCGLMGALNDRLVYARAPCLPALGGVREPCMQAVGLLQPLALGWVTFRTTVDPTFPIQERIVRLMSKFDARRITRPLLDALQFGGCEGAAEALALSTPHPPPCITAVRWVSSGRH
jgi:hypothetical protein